jgi:broad specificity phosphatase PhoE
MSPARCIVLVRHGKVAERYRGICYGQSDIELDSGAVTKVAELSERLCRRPVERLYHSGLARTRVLAEAIGWRSNTAPVAAPELRELNFGAWELRTWQEIQAGCPDGLDRLLNEPESFAPPGGETLAALGHRVLAWYRTLPRDGRIVAVAHGGSIAALRGQLAGKKPMCWPDFVPANDEIVELP